MKKIIGVLCIVLSIPFFAVGGLAAANQPVPVLGPLLGYDPSAEHQVSQPSSSSAEFYTDDDFGEETSEPDDSWMDDILGETGASSAEDGDDVIQADDGSVSPTQSATTKASEFMEALKVVATTDLFKDHFTFVSTTYIDGDYVAILRFPDDSEFTITESPDDGIYIENVFSIQSSVTLDEYDMITDREAHMAYVYEAVMQALGKNVGVGAEEYNTLVSENPLFPRIDEDPVFDGVKSIIASKTLTSDNFNLTITDLVPEEFFISGRLLLSLKNSTAATLPGQTEIDPASGSAANSESNEDLGSSPTQDSGTSEDDTSTSEEQATGESSESEEGSPSGQTSEEDQQHSSSNQQSGDSKNNPRAGNKSLQDS